MRVMSVPPMYPTNANSCNCGMCTPVGLKKYHIEFYNNANVILETKKVKATSKLVATRWAERNKPSNATSFCINVVL